MTCNYLIVGARLAGAALAGRLSENADPAHPPARGGSGLSVTRRHSRSLWVVDASVMPAVPRVVPNLTATMIAERVADGLLMDATEKTA